MVFRPSNIVAVSEIEKRVVVSKKIFFKTAQAINAKLWWNFKWFLGELLSELCLMTLSTNQDCTTDKLSITLDPMWNSWKNLFIWNCWLNWNHNWIKWSLDGIHSVIYLQWFSQTFLSLRSIVSVETSKENLLWRHNLRQKLHLRHFVKLTADDPACQPKCLPQQNLL